MTFTELNTPAVPNYKFCQQHELEGNLCFAHWGKV